MTHRRAIAGRQVPSLKLTLFIWEHPARRPVHPIQYGLTTDDYALLAGTLGLFVILAIAMVLTRKIDWYQAACSARPRVSTM